MMKCTKKMMFDIFFSFFKFQKLNLLTQWNVPRLYYLTVHVISHQDIMDRTPKLVNCQRINSASFLDMS